MKITRYFRQLVCSLALLSCASHAAQVAEPYTTYKRFDSAGRVVGTFTSDPDASGPLGFQAVRNTYSSDRGLLTKVEKGELASFPDENNLPSAWGSFGFVVYSSQEFGYDDTGKKTSQRVYDRNNVLISLTEYSYDSVDRLICTAVRMDLLAKGDACASNNLTGANPDRITKLTYDGVGLVLVEERAVGTSLQQKYSTNTYNGGLLASQTDANGNRTELYYDANGRLKRMIYPSPTSKGVANGTEAGTTGDFVEFSYDASGNKKTERKRSGAIIAYNYDANNRPIFKDVADNTKDVCFDYDTRGLLTQSHFSSNYSTAGCTGAAGITNTYDGFGNLATSNVNQLGASRTLVYKYDLNSNRTSLTHPDNSIFSYSFDKTNRVLGVADSAAQNNNVLSVIYNSNGRRTGLARNGSNSISTQYNFNNGIQLSSFQQMFVSPSNNLTNSFTYNNAGQIASLNKSNSNYYYTGTDDRTGAYAPDGLNRYKTVGATTLDYDLNSNLYRDGGQYYSYDDENRLVGASGPKSANIVYDPNGRLFQTTINGTSVQYVYDGDALVAEYNTAGTLLRRYIHGDQVDEPWVQYNGASLAASNRRYLHSDHQGSIIAHSDTSGNVLATLAYDTYGIPKAQNISVDGAFAYTGQIRLTGLGLYHYKSRAYDPKLGRFLQTDPIGYKDQMNMYGYVGNDPLNKNDPSGLAQCDSTLTGAVCEGALSDADKTRDTANSLASELNGIAGRAKDGKLTDADNAQLKGLSAKGYNTSASGLTSLASGLTQIANKIGERGKGATLSVGDEKIRNGSVPAAYVLINPYLNLASNTIHLNQSYFTYGDKVRQQYILHEGGHVAKFFGDEYDKAGIDGLVNDQKAFMKNSDTYACLPYPTECGY